MVTVLPLGTCPPAPGLWLSTVPGVALLGHPVSNVVLGLRPALVMFDWA
jgi:hypothetical protein